jgi:hypothetical protein
MKLDDFLAAQQDKKNASSYVPCKKLQNPFFPDIGARRLGMRKSFPRCFRRHSLPDWPMLRPQLRGEKCGGYGCKFPDPPSASPIPQDERKAGASKWQPGDLLIARAPLEMVADCGWNHGKRDTVCASKSQRCPAVRRPLNSSFDLFSG